MVGVGSASHPLLPLLLTAAPWASLSARIAADAINRCPVVQLSATGTSLAASRAELLAKCRAAPRNGIGGSVEEQDAIESVVSELEPFCPPEPARTPLSGVWDLVYTTSKGGSSGKVGPLVGSVTQTMVDDKRFINAVDFFGGVLCLALHAERDVIDDKRIQVTFKEIALSIFGNEVIRRPSKGSGVWVQRFVDDTLRVMHTPSLFVLCKRPEA
eukprot:scaffold107676_cov31-Tisochrysis_lutea.AAC.1